MSTVLVESKDGISYIYLNRPNKYNAINMEMLTDLQEIIEQIENNEDRIVIISGKGAAFSAGGDVNMLQETSEKEDFEKIMKTIEKIVLKLYMMPKVIISAIQGSAVGLGLSLALVADYVIAHVDAKLGVLFMGIGLAPNGGGHFFLSERLGVHKAKQFTWGLQQVYGKEAVEMGLVDMVTGGDVLEDATNQAQQLLAAPMIAGLLHLLISASHSLKENNSHPNIKSRLD